MEHTIIVKLYKMKTGKKLALFFGLATGAAVALMAFGKSGKTTKKFVTKKRSEVKALDDNDMNYV